MKMLSGIAFSGLLLIVSPVYAAPTVKITLGPETLIGGFPTCNDHAYYDTYTLIVGDNKSVVARYLFCSAGRPSVELVTDVAGNNFILLTYEDGNGTYISAKMSVFEMPSKRANLGSSWGAPNFPFRGLAEYMTVPIRATSGPQSEWEYKYRIEKPACGGLRLIFTRVVEGSGEIYSIPGQKTRVIEIGTPSKCLH